MTHLTINSFCASGKAGIVKVSVVEEKSKKVSEENNQFGNGHVLVPEVGGGLFAINGRDSFDHFLELVLRRHKR